MALVVGVVGSCYLLVLYPRCGMAGIVGSVGKYYQPVLYPRFRMAGVGGDMLSAGALPSAWDGWGHWGGGEMLSTGALPSAWDGLGRWIGEVRRHNVALIISLSSASSCSTFLAVAI
jgi:hypothetical protein